MTGIEILKKGIETRERNEKLTDRQKKNRIRKELKELDSKLEQRKVEKIKISIVWSRAGNPTLDASIYFADRSFEGSNDYKAGGYGYDKASTVLANMLNDYMQGELLRNIDKILEAKKENKLPYGIGVYSIEKGFLPSFAGGVGVNCYYDIMKFLGYEFTCDYYGKHEDSYTISIK